MLTKIMLKITISKVLNCGKSSTLFERINAVRVRASSIYFMTLWDVIHMNIVLSYIFIFMSNPFQIILLCFLFASCLLVVLPCRSETKTTLLLTAIFFVSICQIFITVCS